MQTETRAVAPFRIQPRFVPRIWGVRELGKFYPGRPPEAEPIGETWLTANDCAAGPVTLQQLLQRNRAQLLGLSQYAGDDFPVLVKFLFPADRLSVQVHPSDAYAASHALGRGKTEMWHVLEAQPGARLGINLQPEVTMAKFIAACQQGRGAECLDWQPAQAGDSFYIPAGTIHALGSGVVICEVQQQSDNTFRLDDYGRLDAGGRPRQLHWDHGFAVARPHAGGGKLNCDPQAEGLLINCPYFRVEKYQLTEGCAQPLEQGEMHVLAALSPGLRLEPPVAATAGFRTGGNEVASGYEQIAEPGNTHAAALDLTPGTCAVLPAGAEAGWQLAGRGDGLDITLPANFAG